MIRNKYNHIPHSIPNTKRERRTHTKFDKRSRKTRTGTRMNRMTSSFPKQMFIQLPYLKTAATSMFTYFLFLTTKQNKTGSIMGNCYSTNHIAEDHIYTDIEAPQQKYRLGTASDRFLGGGLN